MSDAPEMKAAFRPAGAACGSRRILPCCPNRYKASSVPILETILVRSLLSWVPEAMAVGYLSPLIRA